MASIPHAIPTDIFATWGGVSGFRGVFGVLEELFRDTSIVGTIAGALREERISKDIMAPCTGKVPPRSELLKREKELMGSRIGAAQSESRHHFHVDMAIQPADTGRMNPRRVLDKCRVKWAWLNLAHNACE
jgi:hypothetical protein